MGAFDAIIKQREAEKQAALGNGVNPLAVQTPSISSKKQMIDFVNHGYSAIVVEAIMKCLGISYGEEIDAFEAIDRMEKCPKEKKDQILEDVGRRIDIHRKMVNRVNNIGAKKANAAAKQCIMGSNLRALDQTVGHMVKPVPASAPAPVENQSSSG